MQINNNLVNFNNIQNSKCKKKKEILFHNNKSLLFNYIWDMDSNIYFFIFKQEE